MSNVSFSFGSVLQGDFADGNGVYVYATVFGGGTQVGTPLALVTDGHVNSTLTINNLNSLTSGNIVVTMQETHTGAGTLTAFNPTGMAFNQVASATAAATNNYRYDTIELTVTGATGASGDAADLTNIVQFGMPIELSANGQTRGFLPNVGGAPTGQALVDAMNTLSPTNFQNGNWATGSTPLSDQRETYMGGNNGDSTAGSTNLLNNPGDWNNYVQALGQVDQHIRIANFFPGVAKTTTAPAVDPYFVYYDVGYDGHTVTMTPINDANYDNLFKQLGSGVQAMGSAIKVAATAGDPGYGSGNALTQNIYMQSGDITIVPESGPSVTQLYAANNQYAAPVKFLLSGFEAGFWGGQALSIPDAVAGNTGAAHLDLNQSWNWSGLYAYDAVGTANGAIANFDYHNTISSARFDPYAAEVFKTSNAYGWSFSDFIASLGGVTNPTLNLWNGTADADISIKLFGLTDTPTGYTQQALNSMYLPATGTVAATMTPSTGGFNQFIINTQVGIPGSTYNVAPVDGTPMTFRFYSPNDPAHKADGFVEIALPTDYDQNLQVSNTGGWHFVQNGASGLTGKMLITSAPVTGDGSNGWYQLVVGAGSLAKTFNFYTQQTTASGVFTNIVSDAGATSQLASGTPQIAVVNLSSGGSITYAPDYWLSSNPQAGPPPLPPPTPPLQKLTPVLVGDTAGGAFGALSVLEQANLAFSFNSAGDNDTGAFNIAKIVIVDAEHPSWDLTPVVAQSDLYGRWSTAETTQFWDGTYTAHMEQFRPGNWALDRAVGYATIPVTFTVQLDKLPLSATPDGHSLQLSADGSATKGNWIELSATGSTLPNGTLVVYAADAQGHMLARDGHTLTGSLDAAALGRIGSVASDNHSTVFFSGEQHIYLQAGQQLRFAVVSGDGSIDTNPSVNVAGSGGALSINVSDSFGAMNLVAKVNNALDHSDVLGNSQRTTDHPWVYVKQGDQVGVDLAWSADNTNALHFVRVDVNPTDPTKWKVGGVDYGNTDAFRTAVQNNWEFTSTQGHSTGSSSASWTVKGADGFYAPVLVNQQGEIFILDQSATNTANADGHQHIRSFGQNVFGFEDLSAGAGSDFDYNDMVMHLWLT